MSLLGSTLTLLVGPSVPTPAPPVLMEAIDSIQVSASGRGRSGFQITARVGRDEKLPVDFDLLLGPLLQPFSRVVLVVTFHGMPGVLMDGVITNRQLNPGQAPGTSTLTVTGEDVSVMMDLEEKSEEHPAQPEAVIALKIIASYAQYGLIPMVIPPPAIDMPIPIERTPVQQGTDLAYLNQMADRYGYVFYIEPGPAPLTNTAYWGPPIRAGVPQRAISANVGPNTNVNSINFSYNALAPEFVEGQVQDRRLNQTLPVRTFASVRPPLAALPAWLVQRHTRVRQFRASGVDTLQAFARAQGQTDASNDAVLTATGELDAIRYEGILRPRGLVGLRGVGYSHDGLYYVEDVNHSIRKGSYTQSFTLTREGVGSITPVVIP